MNSKSSLKPKMQSKALENPELSSDLPIVNIDVNKNMLAPPVFDALQQVKISQELVNNKYQRKGAASGQKLKEETEKMEKEFNDIMNDLE